MIEYRALLYCITTLYGILLYLALVLLLKV